VNISGEAVIQVLEALPALEKLEFGEPKDFAAGILVKWLTRFEAMAEPWAVVEATLGRTSCSRAMTLRELTLEGRLDVNDDDLVAMVESRISHSAVVCTFDANNAPLEADIGVEETDLVFVRLLLWNREVDDPPRCRLRALRAPGYRIEVESRWDVWLLSAVEYTLERFFTEQ